MKTALKVLLVIALGIAGGYLFHLQRQHAAKQHLAELLPKIKTITVYDAATLNLSSNVLASITSAPFSVELFRSAGSTARLHGGVILKSWWLAVLTLNDDTQRRAIFTHGGGFKIVGIRGYFVTGSNPEFGRTLQRLVAEEFVPKRRSQNPSPAASTGVSTNTN